MLELEVTGKTSERVHSCRDQQDSTCRFRRITGHGFRLAVEVTRYCDLACGHCFVPRKSRHPDYVRLAQLISEAAELGCRKVILTGGEPLTRPDLEQLVSVCDRSGMLSDLNSNLVSLTDERAARLRDMGLSEASVSIYGNALFHDALTGVEGSYLKALEGIRILRRIDIPVDVHCAVTNQNLAHMESVIRVCQDEGVGSVTFFTILHSKRKHPTMEFSLDRDRALTQILCLRRAYRVPIRTVGLTTPDRSECVMGDGVIGVSASFNLKACLLAQRQGDISIDVTERPLTKALATLRLQLKQEQWQQRCFQDEPDRSDQKT